MTCVSDAEDDVLVVGSCEVRVESMSEANWVLDLSCVEFRDCSVVLEVDVVEVALEVVLGVLDIA